MRVAHVVTLVTPTGAYGGPVSVAVNQARQLVDAGHDVTLLAAQHGYANEVPTEIAGIRCRLFNARRVVPATGYAGVAAPSMVRWILKNRHDFDIAHVHMARDLVTIPAALAFGREFPIVAQSHGMIDASGRRLATIFDPILTRPALRRARSAFYLTAREQTELERMGVDENKLRYLPNGVPLSTPPGVRRQRDVLFLARLHPRKNAADFARAAARLAPKHPSWTFSIVGPDEGDGTAVDQIIEDSAYKSQIRREGPLNPGEVLARMARSEIFALPSRNEPFPMSVLEALERGLPCVVTTTCGISSSISDAAAGLVINEGWAPLAAALDQLMSDSALREKMSANARSLASAEFGMQRVERIIVSEYEAATIA